MRIKWIDNAKGIAIILVIIGHVGLGLTGLWDFSFVYGVHLVMFFLISGYTIKKTKISNDFINKKFNRLMIPYFYTCFAVMVMDIINCFMKHEGSVDNVTKIIKNDILRSFFASGRYTNFGNIEYGSMIGAVWFFPALLFALIIFQIIINKFDNDIEIGVCSACIAILSIISARFIWLPFSFQSGCMATFFIYIGYIIKKKNILERIKWYHYILAQFIFLLGILKDYSAISFARATANDLIISLIVGLSGCLLIYLISIVYNGKIFSYLGKNSLLVLCVHLFSIDTLGPYYNYILDLLQLTENNRVWTYILLQIIFAVIGAFVIAEIMELIRTKSDKIKEKKISTDNKNVLMVEMGIFVLFYLISFYKIDNTLSRMLVSCVCFVFVFIDGYFAYDNTFIKNIKDSLKVLTFYLLLSMGCIALEFNNGGEFAELFKKYFIGLLSSDNQFNIIIPIDSLSVILILLIVKIVSSSLDYILKKDFYIIIVSLALSVIGLKLGLAGIWLPFSIDVSCFLILFHQAGKIARKHNLFEIIKTSHLTYFVASIIFSYMIYLGGMNCLNRDYCEYGIGIIGVFSGIVIIFKLSVYLLKEYNWLSGFLTILGSNVYLTIVICFILNNYAVINYNNQNTKYLCATLILQVLVICSLNLFFNILYKKRLNHLKGD